MGLPIKLEPSVSIRIVGCRHVLDGPGGCSTHDVRDADVPSRACTCEFTVCMQNPLHANGRNEYRGRILHTQDCGLVESFVSVWQMSERMETRF